MSQQREFDVVVWGATGFTGRLVARYLARHAPPELRWALGGRNREKLEAVADDLRRVPGAARAPIVTHDAQDPVAMAALARSTRVVATTVGPFARSGLPLVQACAEHGTDYCDITGEVHFIRRSIDGCDRRAKESGSRIVHTCGFDSIPSDLGVHLLAERAGAPLGDVRFVLTRSKGGVSGGTIASMLEMVDAARADPAVRRLLGDPYALSPDRAHDLDQDGRDRLGISWDPHVKSFTGPFPMGPINTRVVRRSNALLGFRYGRALRYREVMVAGRPARGLIGACALTLGVAGVLGAASFGPTRQLLERRLPKPGEGPSERERETGFFKASIFATLEGELAPSWVANVEGVNDPGYGETAKMLGESALSLALDPPRAGFESGVLTPATAFGSTLSDRLRDKGMTFEVTPFVA